MTGLNYFLVDWEYILKSLTTNISSGEIIQNKQNLQKKLLEILHLLTCYYITQYGLLIRSTFFRHFYFVIKTQIFYQHLYGFLCANLSKNTSVYQFLDAAWF